MRVHIMTDMNGNTGHSFMGGFTNSAGGRNDLFERIRGVFDDYAVKVHGKARQSNKFSGYISELTRDILADHQGSFSFDSLAEPCDVQLWLESVNFVHQPWGLERAEIGFNDNIAKVPSWSTADPQMHEAARRMADFVTGIPQNTAIDVWVVGEINPGIFAEFQVGGIAFAAHDRPYAVLAGRSNANDTVGEAKRMMMHEVGHVLGLVHGTPDGIDALLGRNLSSQMCARMRTEANNVFE